MREFWVTCSLAISFYINRIFKGTSMNVVKTDQQLYNSRKKNVQKYLKLNLDVEALMYCCSCSYAGDHKCCFTPSGSHSGGSLLD